jgi:hypothetical protein
MGSFAQFPASFSRPQSRFRSPRRTALTKLLILAPGKRLIFALCNTSFISFAAFPLTSLRK